MQLLGGGVCLFLLLCSVLPEKGETQCSQFQSCDACIQSLMRCKWCSDVGFSGPRCVAMETTDGSCSLYHNPSSVATIIENRPFNNSIQMSPQRTSLKLRLDQPAVVDLVVKPASSFPLDVYFLIDFSFSMVQEINQVKALAKATGGALGKITKDFRYGIGSFVDKNTEPFHLSSHSVSDACPNHRQKCTQPYPFQQHMKLSPENSTWLLASLSSRTSPISANWDSPEAGTDALMQAVTCKEIVGWRDFPARHLLVYISDQTMHFGYDGKIGGVVTPHDGGCHLKARDDSILWRSVLSTPFARYRYTKSTTMDYPSVSMVAKKMLDESIFPIFGVVTNRDDEEQLVYQTYRNISSAFPNAAVMPLYNHATNLLGALEAAYKSISSRINLELSEGASEDIRIKFESKCNGTEWMETHLCEGVVIDQEVPFRVIVTVDKCTPTLRNGTSLTISSGFFGKVTIDVQAICDCGCTGDTEEQSPTCSGFGDLTCGQCKCDPGRCGKLCQCDCGVNSNGTTDVTALECPRGPYGKECSGVGECICGECKCLKNVDGVVGADYSGEACECSNFKCGKDVSGKICGHGTCLCGNCVCDKAPSGKHYRGDVCECYPDDDICHRSPDDESPCSGHGTCECGKCKCDLESGFSGEHCHECTDSKKCGESTITCGTYSSCITCLFVVEEGLLVQRTTAECQHVCSNVTLYIQAYSDSGPTLQAPSTCLSLIQGETCQASVRYRVFQDDNLVTEVYAAANPGNCVPTIPLWAIVVPIIVGLLTVAIVTIILIKLILIYLDYREYKNWMSEVKKIDFAEFESPLYKAAEQTYYCPLYPGNLERGLVGSVSPHLARKALESVDSLPNLLSSDAHKNPPSVYVSTPVLRDRKASTLTQSSSGLQSSMTRSGSSDSIKSDTSNKIAQLIETLHKEDRSVDTL